LTISYEAALQIVERLLDAQVRPEIDEDVIVNFGEIRETDEFWIFFYNTRVYLETGSMVHALVGNGPVLVEKATGVARQGRSDISWEKQLHS
jgi:hypothetical protein